MLSPSRRIYSTTSLNYFFLHFFNIPPLILLKGTNQGAPLSKVTGNRDVYFKNCNLCFGYFLFELFGDMTMNKGHRL